MSFVGPLMDVKFQKWFGLFENNFKSSLKFENFSKLSLRINTKVFTGIFSTFSTPQLFNLLNKFFNFAERAEVTKFLSTFRSITVKENFFSPKFKVNTDGSKPLSLKLWRMSFLYFFQLVFLSLKRAHWPELITWAAALTWTQLKLPSQKGFYWIHRKGAKAREASMEKMLTLEIKLWLPPKNKRFTTLCVCVYGSIYRTNCRKCCVRWWERWVIQAEEDDGSVH